MASSGSHDYEEWQERCRKARELGMPDHKMVGWYDVLHLLSTGINVIISAALGTRSDVRWMEAATDVESFIKYDELSEHGEFWFDYMADTGEGWNSTSRMAYLVGKRSLNIQRNNTDYQLCRGSFLVLGGDEVYPCASKKEYKERLVNPFFAMNPRPSHEPQYDEADLYAIPGNHDWYDGLVSFMRQFLQTRDIGTWRTKQSRSYFALELPCNWRLWGVDTQLEADIDWHQVQYFQDAAKRMNDHEVYNLIVCTAEPYWIYANTYEDKEKMDQLYNNLRFLLSKKVLGTKSVEVYLSLSGDLHHYRHHVDECNSNRHKIVSGGGGAFLHPTHDCALIQRILVQDSNSPGAEEENLAGPNQASERSLDKDRQGKEGTDFPHACAEVVSNRKLGRDKCGKPDRPLDPCAASDETFEHIYRLAAQFPDESTSKGLSYGNLWFFWHNPTFGLVTMAVYLIIAGLLLDLYDKGGVLGPVVHPSYGGLAMILAAHGVVYWYLCDDRRGNCFRVLWGVGHGVVQFAVPCLTVLLLADLTSGFGTFWKFAYLSVGIPLFGYFLGSTLLGVYLVVSLNSRMVNQNEAFSALRIEGYKNFLRLCIKQDGSLVIYPIGVRALRDSPELIEDPVTIVPQKTGRCSSFEAGSPHVKSA